MNKMPRVNYANPFLALLAFYFLFGCTSSSVKENNLPLIVTTTGMLGDAASNLVGSQAQVIALMGPGVDPHLYKATQGDLEKLNRAEIVIYNGLKLEGKMEEIFDKLSRQKIVINASAGIPDSLLHRAQHYENAFDPHIWFDVSLWQKAVKHLSQELAKSNLLDNENLRVNEERYYAQLDSLHFWVGKELEQIPVSKRVLITAHDAFGYFGSAYQIEVIGLQGISTVSDFGLRDISDLTALIMERKISALFVESSVSDKAIKAVVEGCQAQGRDVVIGGQLFSDAMGAADSPEGTYIGMVRYNVTTIKNALLQ